MIQLDAIGQPCPIPVVKAKKAIAQLPTEGGSIQVLVDNQMACENLAKLAAGEGYTCQILQREQDVFAVDITVGSNTTSSPDLAIPVEPITRKKSGLVVAIGKNTMGEGSDELGRILIKGFIFSLSELIILPKAVIFFNSGVMLTTKDVNTFDDLRSLDECGVQILVCGTCVNYYNIKDQVAVGEIVNMYDITQTMAAAENVINL